MKRDSDGNGRNAGPNEERTEPLNSAGLKGIALVRIRIALGALGCWINDTFRNCSYRNYHAR